MPGHLFHASSFSCTYRHIKYEEHYCYGLLHPGSLHHQISLYQQKEAQILNMVDGMIFFCRMKISWMSLARWGFITIVVLLSNCSQSHQFFLPILPLLPSLLPPRLPLAHTLSPKNQPVTIQNPRLARAYTALAAWKRAITSDPQKFTANWNGPDVCSYNGVFCAPAPDDARTTTVAGLDLNNADIAGTLPRELDLLTDLALFHINTNRFCGPIPDSFRNWKLLYELDISNNQFDGPFPQVFLCLPSLKFLDVRFNGFTGEIPSKLFDLKLDALFINNNKFKSHLPRNIGNSPVSVLVLANNDFKGCIPSSLTKMAGTLNEVILKNAGLTGCFPPEIALLKNLTVLDVSSNNLVGSLPESIAEMKNLEKLNVANNKLSGDVPNSICSLPRLEDFTFSFNYFCKVPQTCLNLPGKDDQKNCIPGRPLQRSHQECKSLYSIPVDCGAFGCSPRSPPSSPPSHHSPPLLPSHPHTATPVHH